MSTQEELELRRQLELQLAHHDPVIGDLRRALRQEARAARKET